MSRPALEKTALRLLKSRMEQKNGVQETLGIDARLFLVVAPILAAVSWAAFNIGRAAVGQLQLMLKRSRA